jgi:hypothetical protein
MLRLRPLQEVEREPMSRARPDAREARELRDEVFHRTNPYLRAAARLPPDSRSESHASFALDGTTLFVNDSKNGLTHG